MKQVLIEDTCAGSGSCVEVCPEVFELDGEMAVGLIAVKTGL